MSVAFKKDNFVEYKDNSGQKKSGIILEVMYETLTLIVSGDPSLNCEINFNSVFRVNDNAVIIV